MRVPFWPVAADPEAHRHVAGVAMSRGHQRRRAGARYAAACLALVVGAALWGCRGAAAAPHLSIAVSVGQLTGPVFATNDAGQRVITCAVDLRATATISGSDQAEWMDAVFRWSYGADRSVPQDSSVFPAATVRQGWRYDHIAPGESRQSSWRLSAGVPFTVTIEFRYRRVGGGWGGLARVTAACGPTPESGGTAPEIISLASGVAGSLQPGDTLAVSYDVASALGLWRTSLRLRGPCLVQRDFDEDLARSVSRQARLSLPASCQLGVPIDVSVVATDAALRATVRSLALPALVDTTAPVLSVRLLECGGYQWGVGLPADCYVGDTLRVILDARDNRSVARLTWEVQPAGFRDSVDVSGAIVEHELRIPLPATWAGPQQVRFVARDASGHECATVASAPGAIQVFPTLALAVSVVALPDVADVAFGPRGDVLYLLQPSYKRVAVFSPATMAVTSTIDVPGIARAFDLTVSGDSLVLAIPDSGALVVVDLLRTPVTRTVIPLQGLDRYHWEGPAGVQVAANGLVLVTTDANDPQRHRLRTVDLVTGVQRVRLDAGVGGVTGTGVMHHSPDRGVVILNAYAGALQRYDAATDAFGPAQPAAATTAVPAADQGAHHVAVSGDLYDAGLGFVARVRGARGPGSAGALSPDGLVHYLALPPVGIVRSRISDGQTIDRIRNPVNADLIRASPDGRLLVTAARYWNQLSIVALR